MVGRWNVLLGCSIFRGKILGFRGSTHQPRRACWVRTPTKVTTIRAPEAPNGWPKATAPPLIFTRLGERWEVCAETNKPTCPNQDVSWSQNSSRYICLILITSELKADRTKNNQPRRCHQSKALPKVCWSKPGSSIIAPQLVPCCEGTLGTPKYPQRWGPPPFPLPKPYFSKKNNPFYPPHIGP